MGNLFIGIVVGIASGIATTSLSIGLCCIFLLYNKFKDIWFIKFGCELLFLAFICLLIAIVGSNIIGGKL